MKRAKGGGERKNHLPLVNGKYFLVSILRIADSCKSNNIELTSGVNMTSVSRNNQRKMILKEQQEVAVEELLLGKDVLAVLPTGFGKTMIFTIFDIHKIQGH